MYKTALTPPTPETKQVPRQRTSGLACRERDRRYHCCTHLRTVDVPDDVREEEVGVPRRAGCDDGPASALAGNLGQRQRFFRALHPRVVNENTPAWRESMLGVIISWTG